MRVAACGVCHSDVSALDELFACPTPVILGHEAAGVVEAVGEGTTGFSVGDHVVAAWSPACGTCRFCRRGRPHLCDLSDDPTSAAVGRIRVAGEPAWQFMGVGGFSEVTTLSATAAVRIDPELSLEKAALLGCAVVTGYGAARFAARVEEDDEVAVFGCGGVGLNVLQGARLSGARRIIAIDSDASKLELARTFGATDVLAADTPELAKAVRRLTTDGAGVDYAFDAVGNVEVAKNAFFSLAKGGEVILVGIAHFRDKISITQIVAVTQEKGVRGTTNGSADNWSVIPELVELYGKGELLLDELVSARYELADVDRAVADLRAGRNARGVIVF